MTYISLESNRYLNHPKVRKARTLLREAYNDLVADFKKKLANHECQCTHLRKDHGPSYDVNYTQGVCLIEDCKCLHFLMKKKS